MHRNVTSVLILNVNKTIEHILNNQYILRLSDLLLYTDIRLVGVDMRIFSCIIFRFCLSFLSVLSSATGLYRSYEGALPLQTYSHAFRVSGLLQGERACFDIFGSCHSMPFKAYHPKLQIFLLNHQHLMVENANVFDRKKLDTKQDYIQHGICTEEVNPYLRDISIDLLREILNPLNIDLKAKGFKGIENMTIGGFHLAQFLLYSGGEKEIASKMRVTKDQTSFLEEFKDMQDKEFVDEVGKSWVPFWEKSAASGMLVENVAREIIDAEEFSVYLTRVVVSEDPAFVQERNKQLEGPLFNFVKSHSNALVIGGYQHLYHPKWGLLSRFRQLGLFVQILDLDTGGFKPFP